MRLEGLKFVGSMASQVAILDAPPISFSPAIETRPLQCDENFKAWVATGSEQGSFTALL
jgi:hypothetical protein